MTLLMMDVIIRAPLESLQPVIGVDEEAAERHHLVAGLQTFADFVYSSPCSPVSISRGS